MWASSYGSHQAPAFAALSADATTSRGRSFHEGNFIGFDLWGDVLDSLGIKPFKTLDPRTSRTQRHSAAREGKRSGAGDGIRTRDILLGNRGLRAAESTQT